MLSHRLLRWPSITKHWRKIDRIVVKHNDTIGHLHAWKRLHFSAVVIMVIMVTLSWVTFGIYKRDKK